MCVCVCVCVCVSINCIYVCICVYIRIYIFIYAYIYAYIYIYIYMLQCSFVRISRSIMRHYSNSIYANRWVCSSISRALPSASAVPQGKGGRSKREDWYLPPMHPTNYEARTKARELLAILYWHFCSNMFLIKINFCTYLYIKRVFL